MLKKAGYSGSPSAPPCVRRRPVRAAKRIQASGISVKPDSLLYQTGNNSYIYLPMARMQKLFT
jgi:hypothetical protein